MTVLVLPEGASSEDSAVEVRSKEMMVEAEGRAGIRYSCAEERMMLRSWQSRTVVSLGWERSQRRGSIVDSRGLGGNKITAQTVRE